MNICHLELATANSFIATHHRHHKIVRGHRYSIGAIDNGFLVGVAIVGRPVARELDWNLTLEITRLATNGTRNACSFLYGACARAGKALGYTTIHTYILDTELGTSLKASGYTFSHMSQGRDWGKTRSTDILDRLQGELTQNRQCWKKDL